MHNVILGRKLRAKRELRYGPHSLLQKIHAGDEVIVVDQSWSQIAPSLLILDIQYRDPNKETEEIEYPSLEGLQEDFEIVTEE